MEENCPKCGTPLTTKTIKKQLGLGSIEYPVARICPRCNWSRDLTGASDIVAKPLVLEGQEAKEEEKPLVAAPEPVREQPPAPRAPKPFTLPVDANKLITVALAVFVFGAIAWAFLPLGTEPAGSTPEAATQTPTVTAPAVTATPTPEVTPTGQKIAIKLYYYKYNGFVPPTKTIKPGDEVVWENQDTETLYLVSSEGLFDTRIVPYLKRESYIFTKPGTYSFYLKHNTNYTGTIIVEP